jgi:hypothetical protein
MDGKNISGTRAGGEKLWRVWWLWGIPVGWTVSGLIIVAEVARVAGHAGLGDLLDVMRLLVYFGWARLAWRCSHNVEDRRWTPVSRFALGAGLVSMAMF